jgi:hypothetical protein
MKESARQAKEQKTVTAGGRGRIRTRKVNQKFEVCQLSLYIVLVRELVEGSQV